MAEFKQLGVRILEKLDGGFSARCRVVKKCGIPADDGQVVRVVGNPALQNLVSFAFRQRRSLPANNLRDLTAGGVQQLCGGGLGGHLADMEDEVVLVQPIVVGLDEGGGR